MPENIILKEPKIKEDKFKEKNSLQFSISSMPASNAGTKKNSYNSSSSQILSLFQQNAQKLCKRIPSLLFWIPFVSLIF